MTGVIVGLTWEKGMNRVISAAAALAALAGAVVCATVVAAQDRKGILGLTPNEVRWFTPAFYNDGRQRAQLFGDSSQGGTWIDRVRIAAGARVLAHTHAQDELVTVIEGTWYLGEGVRFDAAKLTRYYLEK
jgi:hypothetical protein